MLEISFQIVNCPMKPCCHIGCLGWFLILCNFSAMFFHKFFFHFYKFLLKSVLDIMSPILRCEGWLDVCWFQRKSKLIFLRGKNTIRLVSSWFCICWSVFAFQRKISFLRQNSVFLICRNSFVRAHDIQSSNIIIFCSTSFLHCYRSVHTALLSRWSLHLLSSPFLLVLKQWKYFNAPILKCLVRQTGACSLALVAQNINETESCISSHSPLVLHPCSDTLISWQIVMLPLVMTLK